MDEWEGEGVDPRVGNPEAGWGIDFALEVEVGKSCLFFRSSYAI